MNHNPRYVQRLRVFISSPNDVQEERQIAVQLLEKINNFPNIRDKFHLDALTYEQDAPALMGSSPQEIIDEHMLKASEADIFIGILWQRMGTAFQDKQGIQYNSGTEYEFIKAYQNQQQNGYPHILLYRCERPITSTDQEQLAKITAFWQRFSGQDATFKGLYKNYHSYEQFSLALEHDLLYVLQHWNAPLREGHYQATSDLKAQIQRYWQSVQKSFADIDRVFVPATIRQETDNSQFTTNLLSSEAFWQEPSATASSNFKPITWLIDPHAQDEANAYFRLYEKLPSALLLGEPGSGKSSLFQKWLVESSRQNHAEGMITLYAPLAKYSKPGDLLDLLSRSTQISPDNIYFLLQKQRLRLLVDGLNECSSHLRSACCQDIAALINTFPDMSLWVSSRRLGYQCHFSLPMLTMQPLAEAVQQQLLNNHLKSQQNAEKVLDDLYQLPGGRWIASQPLLLRIVAKVSYIFSRLPNTQAELYQRFIQDWFERENQQNKASGSALDWRFPHALEPLAALAFAMRQNQQLHCTLDEALAYLRPYLQEGSRGFLHRLAQGLVLQLEHEQFSFGHETIQEYFAAEYLKQQPTAVQALCTADLPSERWSVVLRFLLELQPSALIKSYIWQCDALSVVATSKEASNYLSTSSHAQAGVEPWQEALLRVILQENYADDPVFQTCQQKIAANINSQPSDYVKKILSERWFWQSVQNTHPDALARLQTLLLTSPWSLLWPLLRQAGVVPNYDRAAINQSILQVFFAQPMAEALSKADFQELPAFLSLALARSHAAYQKYLPLVLQRKDLSVRQWAELLRHQVVKAADVVHFKTEKNKINILIQHADWFLANRLLELQLTTTDKFDHDRKSRWLYNANYGQFIQMLDSGLIKKEDVTPSILYGFCQMVNFAQAQDLLKRELATLRDFPAERRRSWAEQATVLDAITMINNRFALPMDFSETQIQTWIKHADAKVAVQMVETELARIGDFSDSQWQQWIENTTNSELKKKIRRLYPNLWQRIIGRQRHQRHTPSTPDTERRFPKCKHSDPESFRNTLKEKLLNQTFQVYIRNFVQDKADRFFAFHRQFEESIYGQTRFIEHDHPLGIGDCLEVKIELAPFTKNEVTTWSYRIKSGRVIKHAQPIPNWWLAWRYWQPVIVNDQLAGRDIEKLIKEGFDRPSAEQLLAFQADANDKSKLLRAQQCLVQGFEQGQNPQAIKEQVSEILAGGGIWEIWRRLAFAFIDGRDLMVSIGVETQIEAVSPNFQQAG